MSLRVVILIPSQKTDPHAHNRKAHTCHTHKAHSKKKTGMHTQPLVCIWGLAWAAVCFKIIARCSQSTMDSGRGMGGRDFKSKHPGLYGASYIHLPLGGGERKKKKNETRCKTRSQLLIRMSASILIWNRLIFIVWPHASHTQKCSSSIYNNKESAAHLMSPLKHLEHAWVCKEQDAGREHSGLILQACHRNKESGEMTAILTKSLNVNTSLLCICCAFLSHCSEFSIIRWSERGAAVVLV